MKKILNVIVLLMVITIMSGCELFTKEEEKFVTFSYSDSVYNDYKCKIKEGKINCMILEPENGDLAFMGWYDENDNKVDIEGEFESSITLHPKFLTEGETQKEKLSAKKYTITFDMNGGSGSIDKVEVEYEGQLYKLKSLPKRSGYVFLGFYDSKETGKGKQYYNEKGESIRNFDKVNNTTLYARWSKEVKQESTPSTPVEPPKEEKKYTITFNVNNGSGGQTSSVSVTNGSTMPSISKTAPTRKGYIFVGWYDNSDYIMGTQYYKADGSSARTYDKTSNMTLYAGWKKEEVKLVKYTVIYDRNGGNGSVSSQSVESGKNINLQENKYTKVGYTFTGWNTQKDSKGKAYKEKESIKVISNITLYAMWSANKYTVTFNLNSGNGNVPNSVTATYGSVMPSISGIPTRSGYTFMGWYDNTDWTKGTQYYKEDNLSARIYNKTSNITLYAGWEKKEDTSKPTYTVAFNLNSGNGTIPSSVKATNGSSMPNITSTVPSKTGYTFMGWYDNSDYTKGKQYYTDKNKSARSYDKKAATTLYAGWKAITFTVSYNSNGGSGTTNSHTCTYDKDCKLSSNGFTRSGYIFTGWKKNNTGSVVAVGSSIKNAVASGTVTYYAQWSSSTYTVSFNINNGSGTTPNKVTATYGSAMPKITTTVPTRTGYTFMGWYDNADYTKGTQYYKENNLSARTYNKYAATTLYAGWKVNTYKITFNLNNGSGTTPSKVTVTYNEPLPKLTIKAPTRSKYVFQGWYDSSDWTKGKKYYNADGTSARPYDKTKSAVLYAGWRKSGENIKVASFNIGYFTCGTANTPNCLGSLNEYQNHSISIFTADTIKNEGIDIIGFQEIRDPYKGGCTIQGKYCRFNNVNCIYSVDYLRYILKSLGINTNNSTELNKHFVHSCPANVDATYSKYEVDTSKTKTYDLGGSRTIDKVVIKVNGVNISFYNTHLGLDPDNEGHWKKMTDIVTKDENPVIITGDFNFREISRYNTYLKEKGFIIAAHDDIKHNMNHNPHYMDSVFVRPYGSDNVSHISVVSSKTIDMYDKYSDHNLIIAELSIY